MNIFKDMTELEARNYILDEVKHYCKKYHNMNAEYKLGDRIPYATRVYDENEVANLVDSALEFWLTSGRYTEKFEYKLAEYIGVKYCLLVNSGSSANLLAFMALTCCELGERQIRPGDEVITVAATFPTTIAPIIQYGAVPVFVDINIPQYNIDVSLLEQAMSSKTKAIMVAHTLGNPFDLEKVSRFCKENNLWLIEDNCDALGSEIEIGGRVYRTGAVGDIGTSSFYPPHHMTMGEGGAVYTNNNLLYKCMKSLRDWGRDCICPSGQDNFCKNRYKGKYGELPEGYDHKYVYSHFGYNLKATDMQAAIGCAQLDKIDKFTMIRRENHAYLLEKIRGLSERLILPEHLTKSTPSWFGFAITCDSISTRNNLVQYLEKNNIQTRMLFSGNIVRHPCFDSMRTSGKGYRIIGELENTDMVMNQTFWLGVYPGMDSRKIDYMAEKIWEYYGQ